MNLLEDKKVLIIYNSTVDKDLVCAWMAKNWLTSPDFIDINGLNDAVSGGNAVYALVDALTDATYDKIVVAPMPSSSGGSGVINYDTMALLRSKLKTASLTEAIATGTAAGGGVTYFSLEADSGASEVDDYYNELFVALSVNPATPVTKLISDYDYTGGSAEKMVTTGGAVVTLDDTTVYSIYNETNIIRLRSTARGVPDTAMYSATYHSNLVTKLMFELFSTTNYLPLLPLYLSTKMFVNSGTLAGLTSTGATLASSVTVTDKATSTQHATDDYYNGKYIYIISGNGKGQYGLITDYTGTSKVAVITWSKRSDGTALASSSSSSVYRIVDNLSDAFKDVYLSCAIRGNYYDITDVDQQADIKLCLDMYDRLDLELGGTIPQDLAEIKSVLEKGRNIFDAITAGVTSI